MLLNREIHFPDTFSTITNPQGTSNTSQPTSPKSLDMAWKCVCVYDNNPMNTICGGSGPDGCQKRGLEPLEIMIITRILNYHRRVHDDFTRNYFFRLKSLILENERIHFPNQFRGLYAHMHVA